MRGNQSTMAWTKYKPASFRRWPYYALSGLFQATRFTRGLDFKVWFYFAEDFFLPITVVATTPAPLTNSRATQIQLFVLILTLFEGMKRFMKFCNVPLIHALKYATINPAKMVNADFVGKIEKNYRADFIVINDTNAPEILDVYVGARKIEG